MVPIKHTVFLPTVIVLKNTVHLIGTIEYCPNIYTVLKGINMIAIHTCFGSLKMFYVATQTIEQSCYLLTLLKIKR